MTRAYRLTYECGHSEDGFEYEENESEDHLPLNRYCYECHKYVWLKSVEQYAKHERDEV